jgi:hypothetical protein
MKNEKWLVRLVVGFTSLTTFALLADGTFFGAVRGAVGAFVLDGLIEYWANKHILLVDAIQRKWAGYMKWAGVGMVFVLALFWAVEMFAPMDAVNTYSALGYSYTLSLHDFILMLAQGMIGMWVVLTLGVTLYLQEIDPEVKRDIERSKALGEQEAEHTKAYQSAMKGIQRVVGTEKAFAALRQQLEKDGYSEARIATLLAQAEQVVKQDRGETVDEPYRAYPAETVNFTPPSTPKK